MPTEFRTVDQLLSFLVDLGERPSSSERLSELDHGLQCAWELAVRHPVDEELALAGLVHDCGHALRPGDEVRHGAHAAQAVEGLLGERVAALVALHVPAKRYLVTVDPHYVERLSAASNRALVRQGGAMSTAELAEFEQHEHRVAAVALRRVDDAAKTPGRDVPGLEFWRAVLERLARRCALSR
ncbi:MAG: metal-dependent phosphohydrolase [Acidimicrobiales bacterium]